MAIGMLSTILRNSLFSLVLLSTALPAGSFAAEIVRLATGEWPPYIGQQLEGSGQHAQRVVEAFARQGVTVELQFYPWKRAYHLARNGEVDGTLLWRRTAEREKHFFISDAVGQYRWVFFHLRGKPFEWKTLADLERQRVGVIRGWLYSPAFDELVQSGQLDVQLVSRNKQLIDLLLRKRVDIIPMELRSGYHLMRQLLDSKDAGQIIHHENPLTLATLHVLLSRSLPGSEALLQRLNRGLKVVRSAEQSDDNAIAQ